MQSSSPRYLVIGGLDGRLRYYGCSRNQWTANKLATRLDDSGIVAEVLELTLAECRQIAALCGDAKASEPKGSLFND